MFSPEEASTLAAELFGLHGTTTPLGSERDQGFLIRGPEGPVGVLKISNANEDPAIVDMETAAALHVLAADPSVPVSAPLSAVGADPATGPTAYRAQATDPTGATHLVRACTFMPGTASIDPLELDGEALFDYGVMVARLGRAMRSFFDPSAGRVLLWDVQHAQDLRSLADAIDDPTHRALVDRVLDRFEAEVLPRWSSLRSQVIHGDVTLDNALVDDRGRISGIIDFGDMSHSALVCDVSAALESLLAGRESTAVVPLAMRVIDGYRSVTPLEPEELAVLPDLLSTRLVTVAVLFGWRAKRHPDNAYLRGWEDRLWPLLAFLEAEGRDLLRARLRAEQGPVDDPALIARRREVFGPALSPLTYRRPLHLVRGEGVWLFDADGERFLDCYNNVPVVGHAHPRVTDAIARQSRLLNTNMRYLHDAAVELAERLIASMPAGSGLDTVLFVNSGSEANDTAWRLATVWTGAGGGLASSFAYHGVTQAIADVSPEEWRGGYRPPHVEMFEALDPYRDDTAPEDAAEDLLRAAEQLQERGILPAVTFVDGGFTSDGILAPPPAYVRALASLTHEVGGPVRRRRGAGRPWPHRREPVVVRGQRCAGRSRDDGQADGQRAPGGRRDHAPGADGALRRDDRMVLDVRRQPRGVRGGARRARRDRGRSAHREGRAGRSRAPRRDRRARLGAPVDRRRAGHGAAQRCRARARPRARRSPTPSWRAP